MITVAELASSIDPANTTLLLGAGASMSSGAPSASQLALELAKKFGVEEGYLLAETAALVEVAASRRGMVDYLADRLRPIAPSGELKGLFLYPWQDIFTTNYDRLVESCFASLGLSLDVVRSDSDFSNPRNPTAPTLFKIHGCITRDRSLGDVDSMVITEDDYAEFAKYRRSLFNTLGAKMIQGDLLVIGQSLRDPHLYEEIKEALAVQARSGGVGKVWALVHESDSARAKLLEAKGVRVAVGGLAELVDSLSGTIRVSAASSSVGDLAGKEGVLPEIIDHVTLRIEEEARRGRDVVEMYNGRPATYRAILDGLTFERAQEDALVRHLTEPQLRVLAILGAAGVGKTSMARRLITKLVGEHGFHGWEHRPIHDLDADSWVDVARRLERKEQRGVLLVDDCGPHLTAVNKLLARLNAESVQSLVVIAASAPTHWKGRKKAPEFFSNGKVHELRALQDLELRSMIRLLDKEEIRNLVGPEFASLAPEVRLRRLRDRCSSDMFVALKHMFANEEIDQIVLREFKDIAVSFPEYADLYEQVAALEATGAKVHRQLVLRLLGFPASEISDFLQRMDGVVRETEESREDGVYLWSTRHLVIARVLAKYKFADPSDHQVMLEDLIDEINPSSPVELRALRDLCNFEYGVQRQPDRAARIGLYQRMISVAPRERVPRHRLIRELIDDGRLEAAGQAIAEAERNVRPDPPILRYKTMIAIRRVQRSTDLELEDRRAMLIDAEQLALRAIDRFGDEKNLYYMYVEVGIEFANALGDTSVWNSAMGVLERAAADLRDPEIGERLRRFRSQGSSRGWDARPETSQPTAGRE